MATERTEPTQVSASEAAATQRIARDGKIMIMLSVVVVIETFLIVLLAAMSGWLAASRYCEGEYWVTEPSAEEQRLWALSDQMASVVGYCVYDNDLKTYLGLYESDDEHVDLAAVKDDFTKFAERTQELERVADYSSDSMPIIYRDDLTNETITQITIAAYDWNTGQPLGGRLILYVLVEGNQTTLTGTEGRDLILTGTVY